MLNDALGPARPVDSRLLRVVYKPGRTRTLVLELWDQLQTEPHRAAGLLRQGLREARQLHSRERRLASEALYDLCRVHPALAHHLGTEDGLALWLGWLVWGGLDPATAEAQWREERGSDRSFAMPSRGEAAIDLSTATGFPKSLRAAWERRFGAQSAEALHAANGNPPVTLRADARRTTAAKLAASLRSEGIEAEALGERFPHAVRVASRQPLTGTRAAKKGWFEAQDAGSQALAELVAPAGLSTVDFCAGAGGKTLALASLGAKPLWAFDVRAPALDTLHRRARKADIDVTTHRLPPSGRAPAEARSPRVLVDAPCTGSGVLRRHPEQRLRWTEQTLAELTALQALVLDNAATLVEPGGWLVYGTCSVFHEENEDIVAAFLAEHPDFSAHGEPLVLLPHRDDTDGFFGQILVRAED